jgi:mono/diheme cytochrome c family protein
VNFGCAVAFAAVLAITVLVFSSSADALEAVAQSASAKATTGQQEFIEYCAQCHGADGTGNGPVAAELKRKPANLTLLAKKHRGIFPRRAVHDFIVGTRKIPSHGTREMPIWGYAFLFRQGAMGGPFIPIATPEEVNARIDRLVAYIRSIQQQ